MLRFAALNSHPQTPEPLNRHEDRPRHRDAGPRGPRCILGKGGLSCAFHPGTEMPSPDVEEKDARAHRGLGLRSSWRVRDWIGLRKGQEAWLLGHMRSRLQSNGVSGSDFRMEGGKSAAKSA